MAIKPLDIPNAAGLPYGEGDVRHFSEGDAVNVPGVANPTRYLAERDNLLAAKTNEIIEIVNNQEQLVPLPVLPTLVAPGVEEVIANFRIPAGFEARVFNASISSNPKSSAIELNVYYAEGFGGTTGVSVATTSGEFSGGVSFQQAGELIVAIRNRGDTTLTVTASVLLTMRPLGAQGTLLVGSIVKGDKGDPGMNGGIGLQGNPGTGGAGSPGMVWTGTWTFGRSYIPKEVASFTSAVIGNGSVTSSAICLVGHTADLTNQPPITPYWDIVAQGSAGTAIGTQGIPGIPGTPANFVVNIVNGTLATGGDWVSQSIDGYATVISALGTNKPGFNEILVASQTGTMAWLFGHMRMNFLGSGTLTLPSIANGARVDYDTSSIFATVVSNGTEPVVSSQTNAFTCVPTGGNKWVIKGLGTTPQRAIISVVGAQST